MTGPKRKSSSKQLLLSQDEKISIADLLDFLNHRNQAAVQEARELLSLAELERRHIQFVLSQVDCIEDAAAILGITTVTLWRKRKQYSLG